MSEPSHRKPRSVLDAPQSDRFGTLAMQICAVCQEPYVSDCAADCPQCATTPKGDHEPAPHGEDHP